MSNQIFAMNCPVIHCARRRVRRSWGRMLVTVLVLLGLSALCGWLWSVVARFKLQVSGFKMAGVPDWVAFGIIGTAVLMLLALYAWRTFATAMGMDDGYDEMREGFDLRDRECADDDPLGMSGGCALPLSENAARIVEACRVECSAALRLVESAQRTLSIDDYGDSLDGAHKRLKQVTQTLAALRREMDPAWAGVSGFKFQREGGAR